MSKLLDADGLRRLADALDRMTALTTHTNVELCAYGTDHIDVDGVVLALQRNAETSRYVVDLSSE
ncbi:hypothetical protein [Streptomyces sp. NPDC006640]|uniref:hypothetical protein n=1 Tax=unclassified Streptomyces TaxID=2593676 RepID=UPI0036CE01DC